MTALLSLSVAMFAGLLMTRVMSRWKLPDVTAYLVAGVLIGPSLIGALGVSGLGFASYEERHESYSFGDFVGPSYYTARFIFPKPDWAPESGTLHVTVVQYLGSCGRAVVIERDLDFSEEISDDW